MTFQLDRFDDFHLHGASAPEWQQRYLQVSPGTMRSALAEVTAGSLHVFRKWMSERVVQQGCLPAGQICFAVPLGDTAGAARAQGRELPAHGLFVLHGGEEFTLQRPPGMALLAVTFELDAFERLLDARPWQAGARARLLRSGSRSGSGSGSILQAPPAALQRWRRELLALFEPAAFAGVDGDAAQRTFESLRELLLVADDTRQGVGSASASYVVARCQALVAQGGDEPPGLAALCGRLRISRRTLQTSFRQVADTTPAHYLRCVRLDAVRRQLVATRPAELSVSQAALARGFTHLGRFAEHYRALFGHRPSQTPRAPLVPPARNPT